MAVFKDRIEITKRLDGHILINGSVCLYYKQEILESSLNWFRDNQYNILTFDCSKWTTIDEFHGDVKKRLDFPDYYGENLNAFNDCISDLDIPYDGGFVVVLLRYDLFSNKFPEGAFEVLNILETNSRRFLLYGRRFITLVQSSNPSISFGDVGGCPVLWNGKEWMDKNRGL